MNWQKAARLALVLTSGWMASCGTGHVDVVNPSVSQMDSLDQQWGLPPRKSRGAPKRIFRYDATAAPAPAVTSGAGAVPAPAAAPSAPVSPPIQDPKLEPAPSVPAQLR